MKGDEEFAVWPTARAHEVRFEGRIVPVPDNWILVKSGDAGLTRRLKNCGAPYWVLVHKRRNRIESLGIYIDAGVAREIREELEAERAAPEYAKRLESSRKSREKQQRSYEKEFFDAVVGFLDFAPTYADIARRLAELVTAHAVPVGSGTVARTRRIPLAERAEAAVIAWMRHQTTGYDSMKIARIKGERRSVRRSLAGESRKILENYRAGCPVEADCPLLAALQESD